MRHHLLTAARRIRRDQSGAAMVEFAFVVPLLLTLMFGLIDFGRAFHYWISETQISSEGARFAAVNRNPAPSGTLQDYLRGQGTTDELVNGSSSVPKRLEVCITFPNGTQEIGDPVKVEAKSQYRFLAILGVDVPTITVAGSATMRLEARPTNFTATCAS